MMRDTNTIAYFTMEIAVHPEMPTYSGGLGILAGDTIRSAADLNLPMVSVCLLHRRGCFTQHLDAQGRQTETPADWVLQNYVKELDSRVSVILEGREVYLRAWQYQVKGQEGHIVPVYFLDSDLPENSQYDRELCHYLYGGDERYRICQEWLLGAGGVKMLRALGYSSIKTFHMNEGHAAFLTLQLLEEELRKSGRHTPSADEVDAVRAKCIFTTHTPVPAGHDRFHMDLVVSALETEKLNWLKTVELCDGTLNMTHLALRFSHYVNGVAKKHGEISRKMFNNDRVQSITNGVHAPTWVSDSFASAFDAFIPGWRRDSFELRNALMIPKESLWKAHQEAKKSLLAVINKAGKQGMKEDVFTIGFARRAAAYKRADLLFYDIERLRKIHKVAGPIQIIYAGKAHPRDMEGKALIQRLFKAIDVLKGDIKIAYYENYDMAMGKLITSGVDLWLNTPQPPLEASGTSGMKAALNGVPSFSSLDGWWIEGHIENLTGWSIGRDGSALDEFRDPAEDARSLYEKLEKVILPLYYKDRDKYINIMAHAISLNGAYFNTSRMVQDYVTNAYFSTNGRTIRW